MSVVRLVYLWCDEPGCDEEFTQSTTNLRSTRRAAWKTGWRLTPDGDICPNHPKDAG